MQNTDFLVPIAEAGIIPVITISDANKAEPLALALLKGGIPCAEITFRTDAAEESIAIIAEYVPDMYVGAGTILSQGQAFKAKNAGAKFFISPGFNHTIVKYCVDKGLAVIPGVATPSDMANAYEFGIKTVKFFPAEQAGGLPYIKACAAPYHDMNFIPTGGIHEQNLAEYLSFDHVIACGASYIVPQKLIEQDKFDEITELCKKAVDIVKKVRGGK